MAWLSVGVVLRIPGLTDIQYGRIADQLYAARDPAVIKADLDAFGDEVWVSAYVQAESVELARSRLAQCVVAVMTAAGVNPTGS